MRSLTRWVLAHRKTVMLGWLVVLVAAFASIQPSADALSEEFDLPGRESSEAAGLIYARYGNGGPRVNGPIVPVVRLPAGTTVDSPGVRGGSPRPSRASPPRCPARARPTSPPPATAPSSPRTGAPPSA